MPYKKSYRRRYKKKPFRKFRKSYQRKKKTGYDGIVYNKCSGTYPVTYQTVGGAYFIINWGNSGISTTGTQYIDDNSEFATLKAVYQQWKLHGVAYKYIPVTQVTTVANSYIGIIESASYVNGLFDSGTTQTEMQRQVDYKMYNGEHKRYYKAGKMYKKQDGAQWMDCVNSQFYEQASTKILVQTGGYSNTNVVGYVTITWYVAFKGLRA